MPLYAMDMNTLATQAGQSFQQQHVLKGVHAYPTVFKFYFSGIENRVYIPSFFYCAWYYNALIVRYITAHTATRWIMRHFSFMLIYTKSIVCTVHIGR